jgi:hypothetical protein
LKEDGFTIPGAKKLFASRKGSEPKGPPDQKNEDVKDFLAALKSELLAIQQLLQDE